MNILLFLFFAFCLHGTASELAPKRRSARHGKWMNANAASFMAPPDALKEDDIIARGDTTLLRDLARMMSVNSDESFIGDVKIVDDLPEGRGVVSTGLLKQPGDLIARFSTNGLITLSTVESSDLFECRAVWTLEDEHADMNDQVTIEKYGDECLGDIQEISVLRSVFPLKEDYERTMLTLWILEQQHRRKHPTPMAEFATYKAYFDSLEGSALNHSALFFSESELKELQGSMLLDKADAIRRNYEKCYTTLIRVRPSAAKFSLNEFMHARLLIESRAFALPEPYDEAGSSIAMVPFIDLVNHAYESNAMWVFDEEHGGRINLVATTAIEQGEQIYQNYGYKCNTQFLLHYGFVMERNIANSAKLQYAVRYNDSHVAVNDGNNAELCFVDLLDVDATDSDITQGLAEEKRTYLSFTSDHQKFHVKAFYDDNDPFHKLFSESTLTMFVFLRVIHATADEMDVIRERGAYSPVSTANEILVLESIAAATETALQKFENSEYFEEEDALEFHDYSSLNERNAILVRLGEKEVLQWLSALTDLALMCLDLTSFASRASFVAEIRDEIEPSMLYYIDNVVLVTALIDEGRVPRPNTDVIETIRVDARGKGLPIDRTAGPLPPEYQN